MFTLLFGHALFNYLSSSDLTGFPSQLLDTLASKLDRGTKLLKEDKTEQEQLAQQKC